MQDQQDIANQYGVTRATTIAEIDVISQAHGVGSAVVLCAALLGPE